MVQRKRIVVVLQTDEDIVNVLIGCIVCEGGFIEAARGVASSFVRSTAQGAFKRNTW
jgi:hypothetical protein